MSQRIKLTSFIVLQVLYLLSVLIVVQANNKTEAPKEIFETWDGHTAKLSLVFIDQNVAIYYDDQVIRIYNSWDFSPVTKAWNYATATYGAFGPNPVLYIFIHDSKYEGCRSASYLQLAYKGRNVIDCGENRRTYEIYNDSEYYTHRILTSIGHIIRFAANGIFNNADFAVCRDKIKDILSYDIYIMNTNHSTKLAGWKKEKTESLRLKIFWFRDWFLPIYEQFGGSKVLKNYLNLTFSYLPHSTTNYLKKLNKGEFIHFWSMAAEVDLSEIAIQIFTTKNKYQDELVQARKSYPLFSYKVNKCNVGQYDCNNTFCINITRRCDGIADCRDESDEQNCQTCATTAFQCSGGGCIPQTSRCDIKADCPDESDEENCRGCSSIEFQCASGRCIPQFSRCDQEEHCSDGSDERNCPLCQLDTFQCTNGKCIRQAFRCDEEEHCSDGSDERYCPDYKQVDPSVLYIDKNVEIHYDDKLSKNITWPVSPLSKAWEYTRNKYELFGPNRLRVNIRVSNENEVCWAKSYLEKTSDEADDRYEIDCVLKINAADSTPVVFTNLFEFLVGFGQMVRLSANHVLNDADEQVCDQEMIGIFAYDIYNMTEDPSRKSPHWKKKIIQSKVREIFWLRDWFFPIYEQFGGSKVLNEYLKLTYSHLRRSDRNYIEKLNEGEFVHFWSMAAGVDLSEIALQTFTSDSKYQKELIQARQSYPFFNFNVECTSDQFKCNNTFCINITRRCDRRTDCSDESDETNCEDLKETSHAVLVVVGISALVILAASIGVGIKIVSYRRRIRNLDQQIRNLTNEEVDEFLGGNSNVNQNDGNGPIHSMPFISDFEIAPEQLVINEQRVLGSGAFGIVKEGKLQSDHYSRSTDRTVAVKMVKREVNVEVFKAFLLEIKIMAFLGHHPNIVSLMGTVTSNIRNCEVFVALEFCSNGDLLHFLKDHCEIFKDLLHYNFEKNHTIVFTSGHNSDRRISPNNADVDTCLNNKNMIISTVDLLEWSQQIADGMNYLTTKKVIHGDLAARNVLLTWDKTAKIGDFGLSRQLMNYSNYLKTSVTPLPWRWLAIESLSSSTFSLYSDIWAFGVTLWEIFTLGKTPYPGRSWDHGFVDELSKGMRLNSPQYGNKKIYDLMMNCMNLVPGARIPFAQISVELQAISESIISKNDGPSTSQDGSSVTYVALE